MTLPFVKAESAEPEVSSDESCSSFVLAIFNINKYPCPLCADVKCLVT
jgi:hypothetical protein